MQNLEKMKGKKGFQILKEFFKNSIAKISTINVVKYSMIEL